MRVMVGMCESPQNLYTEMLIPKEIDIGKEVETLGGDYIMRVMYLCVRLVSL